MAINDIIEVQQLTKSYKVANKSPGTIGTIKHFFNRKMQDIEAVKSVNFSIKKGEIVGFLGANGAGKTTILKMLCGLIYPSSGKVTVGGYLPQDRKKSFLNKITLVMGQKQQLIWDLPPMDSLQINAAIYEIEPMEAKLRIDELAQMLEIGEELTRPVRKLSLGQRMKAELLASLLHRPSVLFLDEPTLGLDVNAQAKVRSFLSDYNNLTGATILLTSHYMNDITALCKRVICIHEGELFYDGNLDKLTDKLSPNKQLRIVLKNNVKNNNLINYGKIISNSDKNIRILVPKEKLTNVISSILTNFEVLDLEINDPPIDELIGKLFRSGTL